MAAASSSGGSAFATSAAQAWAQPASEHSTGRKLALAAARAAAKHDRHEELKRSRELQAMLEKLIELETGETNSLADCSRWDHLNAQYVELVGGAGAVAPRRSEQVKRRLCDQLYEQVSAARNKLNEFRLLALKERDHFEFVSNLVNVYVDLRQEAESNLWLAEEFERLQSKDEQIRVSVENLEAFIGFMREKLSIKPTCVASSALVRHESHKLDEIEELDRAIKGLVDREQSLNQQECEQLTELADILEKILDEGHVDLRSARFRYLTGTLDATRAVILRRLKVAEPALVLEAPVVVAHTHQAAPAAVAAAEAAASAYSGWRHDDDDDNDNQGDSDGDNYDDDRRHFNLGERQEPERQSINYFSPGHGGIGGAVATAAAAAGAASTGGGKSLAAALVDTNKRAPIRQPQVATPRPLIITNVVPSAQPERQAEPKLAAAAAAFARAASTHRQAQQVDNKQLERPKEPAAQPARQAIAAAMASASSGSASAASSASSGFASNRSPAFALRRRFADHPAQQQHQQQRQ